MGFPSKIMKITFTQEITIGYLTRRFSKESLSYKLYRMALVREAAVVMLKQLEANSDDPEPLSALKARIRETENWAL